MALDFLYYSLFFILFIYLFLSHGILVSLPEMETGPCSAAVVTVSPNHWAAREFAIYSSYVELLWIRMIPKSRDAYVPCFFKECFFNTHMCMCCITPKNNFTSLLCLFTMNVNVLPI